ncbi:hypothetical protein Toce_0291 [Thermosediminibacter oceani DSM 16646]|uniref:Uncharacterized protein n=1 Tax=Thermosediminibacter oceani (strain ATCC BAA-1034 / DSM 16646 / JW/IW-1228P) TaxID=555079 RepID=D9S0Q9_THEOJ|nr:hypothetical protein Toce_0291 [Thermosediminibacter oceani DSM 16646]
MASEVVKKAVASKKTGGAKKRQAYRSLLRANMGYTHYWYSPMRLRRVSAAG